MTDRERSSSAEPGNEPTVADVRPVFVCGASRSGTTVTSRVLGRSPLVHTMEELHFFEGMWEPSADLTIEPAVAHEYLARLVGIERNGFRHPAPASECHDEAAEILESIDRPTGPELYRAFLRHRAAQVDATVVCDQTPRNVHLLDDVLSWFPDARVVIVVRDPRDVLLSQKHRWRREQRGISDMSRIDQARLWANYHVVPMERLWRSAATAALQFRDHPRVHVMRFEDLVAQPEQTVGEMCAAVQVDFDVEMLGVAQSGSSHRTTPTGSTGFDTSAIGRWRQGGLSAAEISTVERSAASEMASFGYELSGGHSPTWRRLGLLAVLPIKATLSLALNIRRSRRVLRAMQRRLRPNQRAGVVDTSGA